MMKKTPLKRTQTKLKTNKPLQKGSKELNKGTGKLNKTGKLRSKPKTREQVQLAKNEQEIMWRLFEEIWNDRGPKSEVSGKFLGQECLTVYMHHILPKSRYPEYKYLKSNIIVLSFSEHTLVENDMYRYEEVNKRRDNLKKELGI